MVRQCLGLLFVFCLVASQVNAQAPAPVPGPQPPASGCLAGSKCPVTILGIIRDSNYQCIAKVFRCESCTGSFSVADFSCDTESKACTDTPCKCTVVFEPVSPPAGSELPPNNIAKRYWNPALATALEAAANFGFSNNSSQVVSTKYITASTANGNITLRLEEYQQVNGDARFGVAFKNSTAQTASAEISDYVQMGTSKQYVVRIKNSEIEYLLYSPVAITAIP